ncbi:MAG: tetratricopeptide repeat protein [Gammaproteobacteria bacterium]|nr:tetratricopeptide repeat protein [Gammaproteobacteria bacterium]
MSSLFRALAIALLVVAGCNKTEVPLVLQPLPEIDTARFESGLAERLQNAIDAVNAESAEPAAADWLDLGMLLQAHGIDDAALVSYNNSNLLEARFEARYLAAYLHQQAGQLDAAINDYREALSFDQVNTPTMLRLGEIFLQQGRLEDATNLYERVRQLQPRSAAAASGLGRVALARQQYAVARDHLHTALEIEPDADQLRYSLGLAYRGLGDLESARAALAARGSRGVAIPDPLLARVTALRATSQDYVKAGLAAYESGDLQATARYYRLALDSNAGLVDTRLALAFVLEQLGEIDQAVSEVDYVLQMTSENAMAWYQRGRLHERTANDASAVSAYTRAVELAPAETAARELLADALMRLQRYDEAAEHYLRIVEGEPTARSYYLLGLARIASGDCKSAAAPLSQAYAADRTSAEAAAALIRVDSSCGNATSRQKQQALQLAQQLYQAIPEPEFAETLAMALAANGRFDDATSLQQSVVQVADNSYSNELLTLFRQHKPALQAWPQDAAIFSVPPLGSD